MRDGSERWTPVDLSAEAEQAQGGDAVRYLDVDTTPVPYSLATVGRVVFVASYAGGVYALDAERGAPVWKNEKAAGVTDLVVWSEPSHPANPAAPGYVVGEPPIPKHEALLASSGGTGLWALDPTSGKALWRLPLPEGGITAPVPIAGALLVATTRYGAFLLSPLQGRPIDGIDLGSGFSRRGARLVWQSSVSPEQRGYAGSHSSRRPGSSYTCGRLALRREHDDVGPYVLGSRVAPDRSGSGQGRGGRRKAPRARGRGAGGSRRGRLGGIPALESGGLQDRGSGSPRSR